MTATDPTPLVCPACLHGNTMVGASGAALCFDCQHQWDPAVEVALAPLVVEPFAMPSVEDVYGPEIDPEGDRLELTGDNMIGGTARLEGGQTGEVLSFPSVDSVEVLLNDGRVEVVNLSDVERITPRAADELVTAADAAHAAVGNSLPAPDPSVEAPAVETLADYDARVQMTVTLAELIVKAGIASVEGEGADMYPVAPPVGYLPDDPDLGPVIEQAAAMAVGMLIVGLHLNVDAILHALGAIEEPETEAGDTEVTE